VTIIIATYNRGRLLVERTLPSILAQTYQNLEVMIVGDHCTDDTPELLAQVVDPRVRFYDLPRRGKYPDDVASRWFVQGTAPRNKALKLARGKWLGWISDDDLLLPNHVESLLRFAQKGQYEFVSAAYVEERYGQKKVIDVRDTQPRIGGMQTWLYRSYLRIFKWNNNSWRKNWNKPTDYDLQFRMVNTGVRMGYLDQVVAYVPPVEGTETVGLEAHRILARKERNG
jgi:GT2 family glycosyltransferase